MTARLIRPESPTERIGFRGVCPNQFVFILFFLLRSGSNPFTKGERLTFLCLKEKLQKKQTSVPLDRRRGVDFVTKAR